ncbi:16S rRNA (cytidine(1402)-2'-O)-methyltransferase [Solimonas marina]|uniref:Ribosomal RNA small subunit methyltransferase I n=1 Tax=Solimonas marina TaxID=2714601 RepID=A0A969WAL7_9GAMM|nr:16S rRNA (cytidine(1402)-2'-O)-methyltransferase [Solimonas marina]NKF21375.1 16S rRNA (cytidine(1402)-2'-O)-methyltransferase [Solimonas marina]
MSIAAKVAPGHLYVVATPIGNLGDLSPRAQAVLESVDAICAEDTRTSGQLLTHFGIRKPLLAVHEHNETDICTRLVERLRSGETLALISDAGTPLISDPGFALVRAVRAAELPAVAVPGACAAIAALSIAGLPSDRFVFEGFLPAKSGARRERLGQLASETRTLILYESSHRITDCVADIVAVLGADRPLALARELTKLYEQSRSSTAGDIAAWLASDANHSRGEFVLVIGGAPAQADATLQEGQRVLGILLGGGLSASSAAKLAAEISGARKKDLYALAVQAGD